MKRLMFITLSLAFTACPPCVPNGTNCVFECSTNADCKDGKLCMHEHAHDGDLDICESPCTINDAGVASVYCPDSPLGYACLKDNGSTFCGP